MGAGNSLRSGLGFGVSVLVSDLNENSGFDRSLLVCGLFGQSNMHLTLDFCPDQPGLKMKFNLLKLRSS